MVGLYLFWTGTSTYGFFFWKRKEQNERDEQVGVDHYTKMRCNRGMQ